MMFFKPLILLFDNRLVYYSHVNRTEHRRVVVMSGIFPSEAEILSVYEDPCSDQTPIEIFKHTDDYLITNTTFMKTVQHAPIAEQW
jgi:hypothetical protein